MNNTSKEKKNDELRTSSLMMLTVMGVFEEGCSYGYIWIFSFPKECVFFYVCVFFFFFSDFWF